MLALLQGCSLSPYEKPDFAPPGPWPGTPVPDREPAPEPLSAAGNRSPYEVFGRSYRVLPSAEGFRETGIASWYGGKFHGRLTANGERYDMYRVSAAHKHLPLPTWVRVTNLENGRSLDVRVNDRGPFHGDRILDLSYAAARALGFADRGTARVRVEAISFDEPRGALARAPRAPVEDAGTTVALRAGPGDGTSARSAAAEATGAPSGPRTGEANDPGVAFEAVPPAPYDPGAEYETVSPAPYDPGAEHETASPAPHDPGAEHETARSAPYDPGAEYETARSAPYDPGAEYETARREAHDPSAAGGTRPGPGATAGSGVAKADGAAAWYLQAGAFRDRAAARTLARALHDLVGNRASVATVLPEGVSDALTRVRIGPLASEASAQRLRALIVTADLARPLLLRETAVGADDPALVADGREGPGTGACEAAPAPC